MNEPTSADLNETIHVLLQQGFHPRDIRKQLQTRGVKWDYQFSGQGTREKARRRLKYSLCETGDGNPRAGGSDLCSICLVGKWGVNPQNASGGAVHGTVHTAV